MKRSDLFGTIYRTAHTQTSSGRVFSPPFHLFHMDSCNRYCYDPKLQWNPQVQDYFIKAYGDDHFSRISEALTRPSCYSCIRVNTLKSTSDAVINKLISFLQETKFERDMDWESESIVVGNGDSSNVGLERCQLPGLEHVVIVRGSGPHMIDYGDVPNQPPKEVIVSRKCAEAVLRGAQVYVPGVMACSSHVEEGNTVAVSVAVEQPSLDNGWAVGITRGTVLQGSQTDPHYLERCGLYIGQGMARMSRAGIFRASKGIAVEMTNRVFRLPSFYDVLEGEIFLQNLPSIITACVLGFFLNPRFHYQEGFESSDQIRLGVTKVIERLVPDVPFAIEATGELAQFRGKTGRFGDLTTQTTVGIMNPDPQQGERILDMCAAPGGKTTAIAILMRDKGEIIAVDRSHNKVMDIQKLAAEMGLTSITSYKLDALKSVCRVGESGGIAHPDCINKTIEIGYDGLDTCSFEMAGVGAANTRQHKSDPLCEDSVSSEKANQTAYQSQADTRKNIRRMRNGPGRNQCMGGRVEKSKGFGPNTFDRVLLDAPCSALGLRPRLCAGEETLDSLRNHGKYQRRMFDQAVQLVRPGGVIVYSTCTINPGENEALVRYALDKYKFLSLAPQHPRIGGPGLVGSCELFGAEHVEEWLRDGEEELVQRFDPSSPLDTIGFFIAKFSVGQKET